MYVVVASDDRGLGARTREIMIRAGHECHSGDLVSLAHVADYLAKSHPDLLVVVLSPEPEQGLAALHDARQVFACRVLVIGPVEDPKLILRTQRAGAEQYLDESDLDADLKAALPRLHSDNHVQAEPGKLIALLSPNGGSGVSTLAVNLATTLAQEHGSCFLLDLNLEAGDLATLMNLKPTHTLAEFCHNASRMDRSMFNQLVVVHASGVHLLAPPRTLDDITYVNPQGVRQALSMGRNYFPFLIADLEHAYREEQVQVLHQADLVFLVSRLDFIALRNTRRTLERLSQMGLDLDKVKLLINRYGQPNEVPADKVEEALDLRIYHYVPDEPKRVHRANNHGIPVVIDAPRSYVAKSVLKLAHKVMQHVSPAQKEEV